ncbi:MAG: pseudouridine synthase [Pirellulaceae bacterium]
MNSRKTAAKTRDTWIYHSSDEHDGKTLAAALRDLSQQEQAQETSRGQAKKWIENRQVQVNGNLCLDEARRVTAKDVIKVHHEPLPRPLEARDIRLAHVDDDLIVVEKPAGITTVRHFAERKLSTRRRQLQPTLDELLPQVLAKKLGLRWPPLPPEGMNKGRRSTNSSRARKRPGQIQNAKKLPRELQIFPVHRLDRDTSGLMLFARNNLAEQRLISMFRRHTIQRLYTAFCAGEIEPQKIESMLVRDRGDGVRGSLRDGADVPEDQPQPLPATTHILKSETIAQGKFSKIRCRLETGRTHQIRIHLAEAGHPICGDSIYQQHLDGTHVEDTSCAPRQTLHSHQLEFSHPISGEHLRFVMPLPKDLKEWLKKVDPKEEEKSPTRE